MDQMKKGAAGGAVRDLQARLNERGAKLVADGWFGEATEAAVMAFQRKVGLVVDGRVGAKTLEALITGINDKHLRERDLIAAAALLDVPLAAVKAVNEVETRGSGFIDDTRPVILLERHIAARQASAAGLDVAKLQANYPNLVNTARGGYASGTAEWARFNTLASITSPAIAIEACSWGAFQIMGFHWERIGYASAADMRADMMVSEGKQFDAFVRFIRTDSALLKALRAKKWATFAKLYNGPAYKENLYDIKLARAYERFSGEEA